MNLWVVVPAYNEQNIIDDVMNRLVQLQTTNKTPFNVVICNNNSTDETATLVNNFINKNYLPWHLINEITKGTGAASDTAIRYAIQQGATHIARTDADCLPSENWIDSIAKIFSTGTRMVAGKIVSRRDDVHISEAKAKLFDNLVPLAAWFGKIRPLNRGNQFHGPYVMTAGCNMAIEAELYEQSGGFPRTKIEEVHEDHILINRVRTITNRYGYYKDVLVHVSARRIAEWGVVNTLKWYANHSYCPEHVDIRQGKNNGIPNW